MRIRVWECGRDFHLIRIDIRKRIPMRIRSEFRVDTPIVTLYDVHDRTKFNMTEQTQKCSDI